MISPNKANSFERYLQEKQFYQEANCFLGVEKRSTSLTEYGEVSRIKGELEIERKIFHHYQMPLYTKIKFSKIEKKTNELYKRLYEDSSLDFRQRHLIDCSCFSQRYYLLQLILFRMEKEQFAEVTDLKNEYFSTMHNIIPIQAQKRHISLFNYINLNPNVSTPSNSIIIGIRIEMTIRVLIARFNAFSDRKGFSISFSFQNLLDISKVTNGKYSIGHRL